MIRRFITVACMSVASVCYGQYQMEYLNRGVVAVRTGNNNFVSWRWLGTENDITFNLYRNGTKVNSTPLGVTNFTDNDAPASATYTIRAVVNNIEQPASETAATLGQNYLNVPIQRPSSIYSANDCSVADVDGDGVYEILLKWNPDDAQDSAYPGVTSNVFIDCYKLNGTRLWRIDLGRNIRAGAHYTQMAFYDFDGDGKAEFMCKTADGTKDGLGKVIGNATANYVNSQGKILSGPEFLTVFNGLTGAAMATANYIPARGGNGSGWGDSNGNRVDRFRVGVAYLDGKRPTALFGRGYYTRLVMAAWDWRDGKLTNRWTFDSNDPGNGAYRGQGNHSLSIADVDNDGKQEIISGAAIIDDDGKPYYSTGFGHGDAGHVSDLDPDVPGIEVVNIQESFDDQGLYMYSATGKRVIWAKPSVEVTIDREGPARGVSADISAAHRGAESWARGAVTGVYNSKGTRTNLSTPASCNFLSWWDGDLLRELLDGTTITKYGGGTQLNASGCSSNNGTKSNPCLSGDLIGDWREEVIFRTSDNSALRIYTTTIPTPHKLRTLLHDPTYRMGLAWQNGAYNQPPHVGFYLGDGMEAPAKPNITIVNGSPTDCAGTENGSATLDPCGRCTGGTTGKVACSILAEAEDACDFDGEEETTNTGFKGLSYVNVPNEVGASISFNIAAESAGNVAISFRYANGGIENRPGQLSANGKAIATPLAFTATASWTDWQVVEIQVPLIAGENKFELSATTAGGLPNLDQIGFAGTGLSQTDCGTVTHVDGYDASRHIALYPNPSSVGFNIYLPENAEVKIMNLQGVLLDELEGIGQLYFGENYASGTYLVEVKVQNQFKVFRVSKN